MKFLIAAGGVLTIILAITLVVIGWRYMSAVTTSVTVVSPEPGVHCALASTSDGAALSCWKVDK